MFLGNINCIHRCFGDTWAQGLLPCSFVARVREKGSTLLTPASRRIEKFIEDQIGGMAWLCLQRFPERIHPCSLPSSSLPKRIILPSQPPPPNVNVTEFKSNLTFIERGTKSLLESKLYAHLKGKSKISIFIRSLKSLQTYENKRYGAVLRTRKKIVMFG